MSVAALRSEKDQFAAAALSGVRSRGGVSIAFKPSDDGATRLADLHEYGGFRAKLPRTYGLTEAVLINTGGGLLGGDSVRFEVNVVSGAAAQVTTQSAERVYRSLGPDCRVDLALSVEAGSRLHWLPQETILFNEARLARSISADIAPDATLLMVEATVFGRAAMDETVVSGHLRDVWRIRRGGTLVYADTVRFDGDLDALLQVAALGAAASAMATVLYVAPDAMDRLEPARAAIAEPAARAAVSAWNGMLVGRFLAPTAQALKTDVACLVAHLSGFALPRVWGMMSS
jgi:urease accessory protein